MPLSKQTKQKRNGKWKKYKDKYIIRIKMNKKIPIMKMNLIMKCQTKANKIITQNSKTQQIPKIIQIRNRKLTKKKKVPNEWPDRPT